MCMQPKSLRDHEESYKLITVVVFELWVIQKLQVKTEEMDNTVIHCLDLKGLSHKEVHEAMVATRGEGGSLVPHATVKFHRLKRSSTASRECI